VARIIDEGPTSGPASVKGTWAAALPQSPLRIRTQLATLLVARDLGSANPEPTVYGHATAGVPNAQAATCSPSHLPGGPSWPREVRVSIGDSPSP
jgi:hypothetical protein